MSQLSHLTVQIVPGNIRALLEIEGWFSYFENSGVKARMLRERLDNLQATACGSTNRVSIIRW
jgi:hypothetical protein